jgi:acetoacetate decarboxylase
MPAAFGPSATPPVTRGYAGWAAAVAFMTDRSAVADLMPAGIEPTIDPVVTVTSTRNIGMDWMGGRGYSILSVYVTSQLVSDPAVTAPYSLVIWESDTAPIVAGREFLGTPKMYADIVDADITDSQPTFECAEYGTILVRAEMGSLSRVTDSDALRTWNEAGGAMVSWHWKYIPGLSGEPDADYLVAMYNSREYTELLRGTGHVEFYRPDFASAPYSHRITKVLARLPVLEERPAYAFRFTNASLYRERTHRLLD